MRIGIEPNVTFLVENLINYLFSLRKPLDITIIDEIGPCQATLVKVELKLGIEITFPLYKHVCKYNINL